MAFPSKDQVGDLGAAVLNAAALEGVLASLAVILIGTDEDHVHRVIGNPNRSWLSACIRRLLPTTLPPDLAGDVAAWLGRVDAHMEVRNRVVHGAIGYLDEGPTAPVVSFGRTSKGEQIYEEADFSGLADWNADCGDLLVESADLWVRLNAIRPIPGGGTRYQPDFTRTSEGRPAYIEPA